MKVSVIVTAYNIKEEIINCLKSLHNQEFSETEFIIIDDGSTDGTGKQIINYIHSVNDNRFTYYYKINGGTSDARNYGMDKISDDSMYLLFVDGDDKISEDPLFIKKIFNSMILNNLDILEFNFIENDKKEFCKRTTSRILNGKELFYQDILGDKYKSYVVHYAYSIRFLKENNAKFKEKIYIEDVLFIIPLLLKANRTMFLNEVGYYYLKRDNSITQIKSKKNRIKLVKDHLFVLFEINKLFLENDLESKYEYKYNNLISRAFIINVIKALGYGIDIKREYIVCFLKNKKLNKLNKLKEKLIINIPFPLLKLLCKVIIKFYP